MPSYEERHENVPAWLYRRTVVITVFRTCFWFNGIDSALGASFQFKTGCDARDQTSTATANQHNIRIDFFQYLDGNTENNTQNLVDEKSKQDALTQGSRYWKYFNCEFGFQDLEKVWNLAKMHVK